MIGPVPLIPGQECQELYLFTVGQQYGSQGYTYLWLSQGFGAGYMGIKVAWSMGQGTRDTIAVAKGNGRNIQKTRRLGVVWRLGVVGMWCAGGANDGGQRLATVAAGQIIRSGQSF